MMIFARYQEWVDGVNWERDDAARLERFLKSGTGQKLAAALRNMLLRQQQSSLTKTADLQFEAGYCNGQRSVIAAIESLADDKQFTTGESDDAEPQASQ